MDEENKINQNQDGDDGTLSFLKLPPNKASRRFNCRETTQQQLTNKTFWVMDFIKDVDTKFGKNRYLVKIKEDKEDPEGKAEKFFTNSQDIKYVLAILDEIIDSVKDPGVPIGNYPSQYFENVLLSYLDHWIKESLKVKYYFRYADDMVFLSDSKEELRHILDEVREYLSSKLQLEIKPNFQIFPVEARGIDFVGYVFRHAYTRLRKSVKQRLARKVSRLIHAKSVLTVTDINIALAPWWGWAKYCNSINLIKTLRDEILFKRPSVNLC